MKKLYFTALLSIIFIGAQAQTIGFDNYLTGFTRPVDMKHAGDERLFIVEQQGIIKVIDENGSVLGTNFLDINAQVASYADPIPAYKEELGLLGMAFHPNYSTNGYFYVNYTVLSSGPTPYKTIVSRFTVSSSDPNVADAGSEFEIISIDQPYSNHNGGGMVFGPDGYLYIGTGDGGSGGDPDNNAQNTTSLLGKMLRIDVDAASPYGIPSDNPFVGNAGVADEIWAIGLRNPWRYSFDSETDDLWIADVGQNAREEVNFWHADSASGQNYGWRCYEANVSYNTAGCSPQSAYTAPVFDYPHSNSNGGFSITGGYVYRGCNYPGMVGSYIFIDYSSGNLWTLTDDGNGGFTNTFQANAETSVAGFGQDVNGELYVLKLNGVIKKVTETGIGLATSPTITENNGVLSTSSSGNLQWYLNGTMINGATNMDYTPLTSGDYTVVLTVGACMYTSNQISYTVTAVDSDNDGLSDDYENANNTDPNDPDSDNDNVNDGDEVLVYFTDPNNPDTDNDGFNDDVEIAAGSDPNDINDFPSGIRDIVNYEVVQITPNPANDMIQLTTNEVGKVAITIYDLFGNVIRYQDVSINKKVSLSVQNLPQGMYLVAVEGDSHYRGKFIVQ